jgi:hypothetical protein
MRLMNRLKRLSARVPKHLPPLPGIDREWQTLARSNREAHTHAAALQLRKRLLWPDREPTSDEVFADDVGFHHLMWLESTAHGGLSEFLGQFL